MDYTDLSKALLQTVYDICKVKPKNQLTQAVHGEAFALQFIAQHDDAVIPSDIETTMSVSSARIAAILGGLENKKLITRRIDPLDRRRTILKLTPEGEELAAKNMEQLLDIGREMLAYLGEDDAQAFVRIMGKIAERFAEK